MANDNNVPLHVEAPAVLPSRKVRDVAFKVLLVGDCSVGKTSLVTRYVEEKFESSYKSTIGACFYTKSIAWSSDTNVHLQFWDLAGQDRLNNQVKIYYRDAAGALCVCDAAKIETRQQVLSWKRLVDENSTRRDGSLQSPPSVMIVNKMDLYSLLDDPWIDNQETPKKNIDESFYSGAAETAEDPDCLLAVQKTTYDDMIDVRRDKSGLKMYPETINRKINDVAVNCGFHGGVPTSVKDNVGVELAIEILVTEMLRRYDSEEERQRRQEIENQADPAFRLGDEIMQPKAAASRCNYC